MGEVTYPPYRLSAVVFQTWLRHTFRDNTIVVESQNGYFVFNLSDADEMEWPNRRGEIKTLKGKTQWKPPKQ